MKLTISFQFRKWEVHLKISPRFCISYQGVSKRQSTRTPSWCFCSFSVRDYLFLVLTVWERNAVVSIRESHALIFCWRWVQTKVQGNELSCLLPGILSYVCGRTFSRKYILIYVFSNKTAPIFTKLHCVLWQGYLNPWFYYQ